jgi:hypothetical protein
MGKITGVDGKPVLRIDKAKLTPSKLKCLESENVQSLLEVWAAGDVDNADAQTWLMFQMVMQLMTANIGSGVIMPTPH